MRRPIREVLGRDVDAVNRFSTELLARAAHANAFEVASNVADADRALDLGSLDLVIAEHALLDAHLARDAEEEQQRGDDHARPVLP
jgi:hypothetical protein